VVSMMAERPGAARSSESGADTEQECRGKRYKWQKYSRPSHNGSYRARHKGGHWGVDGVHKAEPAADKTAGDDEAKDARGQGDNDLQHIEFQVRGVGFVTVRNVRMKDSDFRARTLTRNCGMRIAGKTTNRILA